MQKWYDKLSKGQKLTILIPALVSGFVFGYAIDSPETVILTYMVIVPSFIFFELGKKK